MFRTLFLVLALAGYGGYSLTTKLSSDGPAAEKAETAAAPVAKSSAARFSLAGASDLAAAAASMATGVGFQELPEEGCSESMLSPEQVMELLDRLPDAQRTLLARAMQASSSLWTAQLYRGELGLGMCLPAQGKLLRLPLDADAYAIPSNSGEASEAIRSLVDAVKPAP